MAGGDGDPMLGYPVQVDQVVGFDLACGTQTTDHLADQDGIVLGQLDHGRRDAPSVAVDQHAMPTGDATATGRCSSTGKRRHCGMDARARPEPPSSVGTGRSTFVETMKHMGFSFAMKGNAKVRPAGGELGVPRFGTLREAEQFRDTPSGARK